MNLGKCIQSKGHSKCKGPKVAVSMAGSRTSKQAGVRSQKVDG